MVSESAEGVRLLVLYDDGSEEEMSYPDRDMSLYEAPSQASAAAPSDHEQRITEALKLAEGSKPGWVAQELKRLGLNVRQLSCSSRRRCYGASDHDPRWYMRHHLETSAWDTKEAATAVSEELTDYAAAMDGMGGALYEFYDDDGEGDPGQQESECKQRLVCSQHLLQSPSHVPPRAQSPSLKTAHTCTKRRHTKTVKKPKSEEPGRSPKKKQRILRFPEDKTTESKVVS